MGKQSIGRILVIVVITIVVCCFIALFVGVPLAFRGGEYAEGNMARGIIITEPQPANDSFVVAFYPKPVDSLPGFYSVRLRWYKSIPFPAEGDYWKKNGFIALIPPGIKLPKPGDKVRVMRLHYYDLNNKEGFGTIRILR